ncbi:hypothetical protein HJFPF1_12657 [Paramyrothecium foliicola]|nr:hypothetical protein HJFPF1_12657 [Paramyrothecium foliicola]
MLTRSILYGLCASALVALVIGDEPENSPIRPNHDSARENSNFIFNAVHSAGRQWGSSLNHNGLGFLPAVVSKGTLLYHGDRSDQVPSTLEWLAFEAEHAGMLATSNKLKSLMIAETPGDAQVPLDRAADDAQSGGNSRGYLHTYRANRDLNLLYFDGTSAAKTLSGTLDAQDHVLLENRSAKRGMEGEVIRAENLCKLATEWGYDGLMRMEIGFEVIFCDFSNGLERVSVTRSFMPEDMLSPEDWPLFHLARAASQRYDGLGGDRVRFDFSSMVSGFFFPINISSMVPGRPELKRFASARPDELKHVKNYVREIVSQPRRFTVNWQTITDMIVARFSDALALMAWDGSSPNNFVRELERTILPYFDAPPLPGDVDPGTERKDNLTSEAISRCTNHYLLPAALTVDDWSLEDKLIHTAVQAVTGSICGNLFTIRSMLLEASLDRVTGGHRDNLNDPEHGALSKAIRASRAVTRDVVDQLAWTTWRKKQSCAPDQVMFAAMWPFGNEGDHWTPGCRTRDELNEVRWGYWKKLRGSTEIQCPIFHPDTWNSADFKF